MKTWDLLDNWFRRWPETEITLSASGGDNSMVSAKLKVSGPYAWGCPTQEAKAGTPKQAIKEVILKANQNSR